MFKINNFTVKSKKQPNFVTATLIYDTIYTGEIWRYLLNSSVEYILFWEPITFGDDSSWPKTANKNSISLFRGA